MNLKTLESILKIGYSACIGVAAFCGCIANKAVKDRNNEKEIDKLKNEKESLKDEFAGKIRNKQRIDEINKEINKKSNRKGWL